MTIAIDAPPDLNQTGARARLLIEGLQFLIQ